MDTIDPKIDSNGLWEQFVGIAIFSNGIILDSEVTRFNPLFSRLDTTLWEWSVYKNVVLRGTVWFRHATGSFFKIIVVTDNEVLKVVIVARQRCTNAVVPNDDWPTVLGGCCLVLVEFRVMCVTTIPAACLCIIGSWDDSDVSWQEAELAQGRSTRSLRPETRRVQVEANTSGRRPLPHDRAFRNQTGQPQLRGWSHVSNKMAWRLK